MEEMPADGLPPAHQPFDVVSLDRWPMATEKRELWHGVLVFYGDWDERDLAIARRAFPGRGVALDDAGVLLVGPRGDESVNEVDELIRQSMGYETLEQVSELRRQTQEAMKAPPGSWTMPKNGPPVASRTR